MNNKCSYKCSLSCYDVCRNENGWLSVCGLTAQVVAEEEFRSGADVATHSSPPRKLVISSSTFVYKYQAKMQPKTNCSSDLCFVYGLTV